MKKYKNTLTFIIGICLFVPMAVAQPNSNSNNLQSQSRGEHRGPPKEAITACENKASGDACDFTDNLGSKSGTCFTPKPEKPLACKPEGHKPPENRL